MAALCWTFIGSAVLCYAYAAYVILCAIALRPWALWLVQPTKYLTILSGVYNENLSLKSQEIDQS